MLIDTDQDRTGPRLGCFSQAILSLHHAAAGSWPGAATFRLYTGLPDARRGKSSRGIGYASQFSSHLSWWTFSHSQSRVTFWANDAVESNIGIIRRPLVALDGDARRQAIPFRVITRDTSDADGMTIEKKNQN
jgi:hypothetical protein